MTFFYDALVFVHFVGWAIVLGGYLASLRGPGLSRGLVHGATTALVAGSAMMGLIEAGVDGVPPAARFDMWGMRVKLLLTLAVAVLAFVADRSARRSPDGAVCPWVKHSIGALTAVTVAIAVFWQ